MTWELTKQETIKNFNELLATSTSLVNTKSRSQKKTKQETHLSCSILRRALRLWEFALSALATITQAVVAAAVSSCAHHSSCAADRWVDVMIVRTGTARCLHVVVSMRPVSGSVYNGGELGS
jgi:hypothetical protein